MTNEELAVLAKAGDRDRMVELWGHVYRMVYKEAARWAIYGRGGTTIEDLTQVGAIAMLVAVDNYDPSKSRFSTHLFQRLRAEFSAATGQSTKQAKLDPLQTAISLDTPLTDDDDSLTFADTIEDPAAVAEIESTDIRLAIAAALSALPEEQRQAVVGKYWYDRPVDAKAHAAALRRLRHPSISRALMVYL